MSIKICFFKNSLKVNTEKALIQDVVNELHGKNHAQLRLNMSAGVCNLIIMLWKSNYRSFTLFRLIKI